MKTTVTALSNGKRGITLSNAPQKVKASTVRDLLIRAYEIGYTHGVADGLRMEELIGQGMDADDAADAIAFGGLQ